MATIPITAHPDRLHMSSLEYVQTPRFVRRLARWLIVLLALVTAAMLFLPWQQTTRGSGRVVAYHPTERPQTVECPINGRIVRWGEGIVEGARVSKGQLIVEIQDNDPSRADRLDIQVLATSEKLSLSEMKAETYGRQAEEFREMKAMVVEAGRQLVAEAQRKLEAEQHGVEAAEAAVTQTKSNFERQRRLFEQGFTSGVGYEKERRGYEEAVAKHSAAQRYVEAAGSYLKSKEAELEQKTREAQAKIDYARAMQQEALGEVALARKELAEVEGKRAQFSQRDVRAPRDGIILRLLANDQAEMLKEGDPLFTIVPEAATNAVELWIDGNDLPLVRVGREVRLQFEGWPAIQFAAGWPHTAIGTFSGVVVAVDATDNGQGKFRVLVRDASPSDWPSQKMLRQGVRSNGWILLNRVTLGYEIWRQLNGFPAVYDEAGGKATGKDGGKDASKDSGKDAKKVKLPK